MPKLKLNPQIKQVTNPIIMQPSIFDNVKVVYHENIKDCFIEVAPLNIAIKFTEKNGDIIFYKPLIVGSVEGFYPYSSDARFRVGWCQVQNFNDAPDLQNLFERDGVPWQKVHESFLQLIATQQPDVTVEIFETIIKKAWMDKWSQPHYKFKAHNFLITKLNISIQKIIKVTISKGKVYTSYLLKSGKKGSTILSQRKLDEMREESEITFLPEVSEFYQDQYKGWLVFAGYRIIKEGLQIGYVVASSRHYDDFGYVFVETRARMLQPETQPIFMLDKDRYKYSLSIDVYEAIFAVNPDSDGISVSGNIFPDKFTNGFRKAKEDKGFAQYVGATTRRRKEVEIDEDEQEEGSEEDLYEEDEEEEYEE